MSQNHNIKPKLCAWEGPFCRGSRMNLQLVPMGSLAISKQAAIVFRTIVNEQNKLRKKKREYVPFAIKLNLQTKL